MGFFSGIKDAVKKVGKTFEDKVLEPIAKDAIPATAAYFTGGKSLAFIPPSDSGLTSKITNELFDVNAGDLTSGLLGGFGGTGGLPQIEQPQPQTVKQPTAGAQGISSGSGFDLSNLLGPLFQGSRPVPQQQPSAGAQGITTPKNNTALFLGIGGGVLALVLALVMTRKK